MNGYKGLTEIKAKKIEMLGLNEIKEKKKHKFRGISREYFVYYLKEFEFSYNLGLTWMECCIMCLPE